MMIGGREEVDCRCAASPVYKSGPPSIGANSEIRGNACACMFKSDSFYQRDSLRASATIIAHNRIDKSTVEYDDDEEKMSAKGTSQTSFR